jgi:hypothetical protein
MGVRCTISVKKDDGAIESTYCYGGGSLEHVGLMLYQHYQDCTKAQQLLSMGHIHHLDENIDMPSQRRNSLEYPLKGYCAFIRRDSDEKVTQFQSQVFDTIYEYKRDLLFEEYNYFFNYIEKLWYVFDKKKDQFCELGTMLLNSNEVDLTEEFKQYIKQRNTTSENEGRLGKKKF